MLKRLKKGKQKQKSSDLGESLKAKKPATYSPIYKQIIIEAVKDLTIMKMMSENRWEPLCFSSH